MLLTENMRSVIVRLQRMKIDPDEVSPHTVAIVAYDLKRELTSEQIVYISDNYKPRK